MSKRIVVVLVVAIGCAAMASVASSPAGAKPRRPALQFANYGAPTFNPVVSSAHNKNGNSVCGNFVPSQPPDENNGDLNTSMGSFLTSVQLPNGASISKFTMYANDFDAADSFAFLMRKRYANGLSPAGSGIETIADVKTDGAVNGVMRAFADNTITAPKVDNRNYYYWMEIVNCAIIEPYDLQIAYRPAARRRH